MDELFGAVRAFSDAAASARTWAGRTEKALKSAWAPAFLLEARRAHELARARLADIERRLAAVAGPNGVPAPFDRLAANLDGMRADLEGARDAVGRVEALVAERSPRGSA